ncbi:MAG: beta-ketoacyl-ACP synthase II, partial [Legionellales bacterium]|nr:beta-ketoacyl-ACP synthase II [Legionellales bacterium]
GASADAYHITAPSMDGDGAYRSMEAAIEDAKIDPSKIGYINAHGTSTPAGDEVEVAAVKRLFTKGTPPMSSTKSMTGHLLGAAGAIECVFSILAMRDNVAPPTINLDNPADGCDINLIAHTAQEHNINYTMSNSFGFGGTNGSLIFKAI